MIQCGRPISGEEIEEIRETVATCGGLSRNELAMTICEHLGWCSASGSPKVEACHKLLEMLEKQGALRLPGKRAYRRRQSREQKWSTRSDPQPPVEGRLSRVGWVRLAVVREREDAGLWKEFVSRYHYLGYKPPFGCYLRYFVESEAGTLGCLLFSGAAMALGERDHWIGWSERERLSRLGYRPVLLETFVDPRYYEGTCYRAANWRYLGMTTGEGLVREGKSYTTSPKKIFALPLVEDFRSVLCSLPERIVP